MSDSGAATAEPGFAFGPFRLLPLRKILLAGERPYRLGSRAIEILALLVQRSGELVSKEELMAHVWPNTHVEEINLRVNIAAIRKALGDTEEGLGYVASVPGRGYRFIAPVVKMANLPEPSPPREFNLPSRLTRMIGRDEAVAAIARLVTQSRFATIVGPGGIGKTTVALATARMLAEAYPDGVFFIDLAPLMNPALVASALAAALGLPIASEQPLPGLVAYLRERAALILLDNCEHVVGACAVLAETLLQGAPRLHILATSREAMRADGERLYRLAPMEVPAEQSDIDAALARTYSAIALFAERAAASDDGFRLSDDNARDIARLCRRLDGLPLAIELAAARVDMFSVRMLATGLDHRFLLLAGGRRTALPRHRTLHATLSWSYELLSPEEQVILQAVAVFKAAFSVESALAMLAPEALPEHEIISGLESLSQKSLLSFDSSGPVLRCRLLESTRAFALDKAAQAERLAALTRRHARHLAQLLTSAEAEWEETAAAEWIARYGPLIDDTRAALEWALGEAGEGELATRLAVTAVPLWMNLSLNLECAETVAKILAQAAPDAKADEQARRRMKLHNALGLSLLYTKGPGPQIEDTLNRALVLATRLGDVDYRLRAMWGLCVVPFNAGHYAKALKRTELFRRIAASSRNPNDLKAGARLQGFTLHMLGDQRQARAHIEDMLASYVMPKHRADHVRFQYDQRVAGRVPLSAILWLQGFPDQAMATAAQAVEIAQSIGHAISVGYALATAACPTAFLAGDLTAAERYVGMLAAQSAAYGLGPWSAWGRYFGSLLAARRGQTEAVAEMGAALAELHASGFALRYTYYLAEYAELLGKTGRAAEGLAVIEQALERCRHFEEGWCLAELLRIKGELLLQEKRPDMAAAEALFREALAQAEAQGALSWALRIANSVARLCGRQNRRAEARDLLNFVHRRVTEGFDGPDAAQARQLLAALE